MKRSHTVAWLAETTLSLPAQFVDEFTEDNEGNEESPVYENSVDSRLMLLFVGRPHLVCAPVWSARGRRTARREVEPYGGAVSGKIVAPGFRATLRAAKAGF